MGPEDVLKGYVDGILRREGWSRTEVRPMDRDELSGMDGSELRAVLDLHGRNNERLKMMLHRVSLALEFEQDAIPSDNPGDGWFLVPTGFIEGLQPFMDLEAGRSLVSDARDILISRGEYVPDPDEASIMDREVRLSLAYRYEFEHGDFFRGRGAMTVDAVQGTVVTSRWGREDVRSDPVLAKDLVRRIRSIYMADWLEDYRGGPTGHIPVAKWSDPVIRQPSGHAADGYGWSLTVYSEGYGEPLRFRGYIDIPYNYHQLVDVLDWDPDIMDVYFDGSGTDPRGGL